MKFLALLTTLLLTLTVQAGDQYYFQSLGFSADGDKYAFAQFVIADGSGFPVANVYVMDVATGKELKNETVVLEDEGATIDQALSQALMNVNLPKYGIDGKFFGRTLVDRRMEDLSSYTDTRFRPSFPDIYNLNIEYTKTTGPIYCAVDPQLIRVTLSNENTPGTNDILIDESKPTKERECAFNHEVSKVIVEGEYMVVIIAYSTQGFEGPNREYMAIGKKGF